MDALFGAPCEDFHFRSRLFLWDGYLGPVVERRLSQNFLGVARGHLVRLNPAEVGFGQILVVHGILRDLLWELFPGPPGVFDGVLEVPIPQKERASAGAHQSEEAQPDEAFPRCAASDGRGPAPCSRQSAWRALSVSP